MTDQIARQAKGQPTGGQFAAHARTDSDVALLERPPQPGEYVDEERHDWLDRSYTVRVNVATGLTDDDYEAAVDSFITAALWATADDPEVVFEENPSGMLDGRFSANDISDETLEKIRKSLTKFLAENRTDVREALDRTGYSADDGSGPIDMLGHDIFLTSAHHGAGFWDRDVLSSGGLGRRLTDAAHDLEEFALYPGDDGKLYA